MALEALEMFIRAKQNYDLVIADLPGGMSEFTEIVTVAADAGVIITKDPNQLGSWQQLFGRLGIKEMAKLHSPASENARGLIRETHGKVLSGQITKPQRGILSFDPFLWYLIRVMLFDSLPSIVDHRERKLMAKLAAKP